MIFGSA